MQKATNDEIINGALAELKGRKPFMGASPCFAAGFVAGLGFMGDGYSEDDSGTAFDYLEERWRGFSDENPEVGFQANFKQINATDGRVKLVFEPVKNVGDIVQAIIHMNGSAVFLSVSNPQLKLELKAQGEGGEEAGEGQLSMDEADNEDN